MNIEELTSEPRKDGALLVQLRERCATEAFQAWIDARMQGWRVKRVLAEPPCQIAIVVERDD